MCVCVVVVVSSEVAARIRASSEIGASRTQKMQDRATLLSTLLQKTHSSLAQVPVDANYAQLLKKLVIQALIKIEEQDGLVVYCTNRDLATLKKVLPDAITEYKAIMQTAAKVTISPSVKVNEDRSKDLNPELCGGGGVIITAQEGRIVCDNSLGGRVGIVWEELLPSLREIMFPAAEAVAGF